MRSTSNVGDTDRAAMPEPCYFCVRGTVEEKRVTVALRWGGTLVIIENVPATVCNACGERSYAASVVRHMEPLAKEGRQEPELHVPVVTLAEVTQHGTTGRSPIAQGCGMRRTGWPMQG